MSFEKQCCGFWSEILTRIQIPPLVFTFYRKLPSDSKKNCIQIQLEQANYYNDDTNNFDEMLEWVLDTDGTNLIELL